MGINNIVARFMNQVVDYLPSLVGGLLLMAIGWVVAWFVKRMVVQICMTLKLGRLLGQFRWARGLSRADARHPLYGLLGSLVGLVVFLVFLNSAFLAMRLTVVAGLLERMVSLFPRLVAALTIFALGWLVAFWTSLAIHSWLRKEEIPRASFFAGFAQAVLLLLFAAMAVAELDIAREIVVIGFSVIFVTLGTLTVIVAIFGGREVMQRLTGASGTND
jgi:Mechanosensitive ion channel, conserved TM helix